MSHSSRQRLKKALNNLAKRHSYLPKKHASASVSKTAPPQLNYSALHKEILRQATPVTPDQHTTNIKNEERSHNAHWHFSPDWHNDNSLKPDRTINPINFNELNCVLSHLNTLRKQLKSAQNQREKNRQNSSG